MAIVMATIASSLIIVTISAKEKMNMWRSKTKHIQARLSVAFSNAKRKLARKRRALENERRELLYWEHAQHAR